METEVKWLKNFVGGGYLDPAAGRFYGLENPSTGETFAEAPASG